VRNAVTPPRTGAKPGLPPQREAVPAKAGTQPSAQPCCACRSAQPRCAGAKRPRMKTLLGHIQRGCAGRVRLGHMTNSLFTLQSTPRPRASPDRCLVTLLRTSRRRRRIIAEGGGAQWWR